ncbi:38480_t:CDS:2, partial [Gigaspora margarita]
VKRNFIRLLFNPLEDSMSALTRQSENFIVEVKNEEKEPEAKKYELEINEDDKRPKDKKSGPEGDFLVEFVVKNLEFELQMYDIKNSNNKDGLALGIDSEQKGSLEPESGLELGDDQESSYSKLSSIPTTFKFTETQLNLINNEHDDIHSWFVAVSNKTTCSSEFRLLAISFTSLKDMEYYKKNSSKMHPSEIQNHGFTFESPIKYGGIVKLFSKKDYINGQKTEKDNQSTDKSSQNTDGHFLILLTVSGIHKYHMKNKSINNIQKLKYPKRTYDVIIYNFNPFFDLFDYISNKKDLCTKAYNNMCLNKHYFLVDTTREDFKYIELYDLMTNQLVNTFQRQMVYRSIVDFPACYACYAISNNSKLLAYESIQAIKIYSTECSLEIAELAIANLVSVIFMDFFHNDEMLLIYSSKNEWTIWNIFGSLQNSVTLENPGLTVELPSADKFWEIDQSNSFVVVNNDGKLTIYDDLIVDKYLKYLKKSNKQDFKKLSKDYLSRQNLDKNIPDLHDKESKLNEFDNLEPWLVNEELKGTQFSFYLDEKKEKLLLIGKHTIQVWYNQGPSKDPEKRTLEFIYMPLFPLPVFSSPKIHEVKEWESNTIEVIGIEYCIGKFKLSILTKDTKDSLQIKMEDEDDIINIAKYACYTLKYFSVYKNFKQTREKGQELKFNNIIKQTRKIILRFIRICPINWRLLDIRFGLMNVLIEAGDYELINDILSFGIPIHIPQYFPWSSEKNTIRTALLDHTMLALLLEYYSNNAVDNIGWMRTVVDIITELFKSSEEKIGNEKVSPKSNDLLKVFIPITQLIPQDSELDICDIDYNKIVDIRMVPLTDFTTSKRISDIRERKPTNFLKLLISPSQYSSLKEEDYSPFIKLVKTGEREILYENPSMGAVINWMWYCSKFYWPRTL